MSQSKVFQIFFPCILILALTISCQDKRSRPIKTSRGPEKEVSEPGGNSPDLTPSSHAPPTANSPQFQQSAGQETGGIDGGGGNYVGSEPKQIRALFNGDNGFNLKETMRDVFDSIGMQIKNKILDPEAESIFSRMLGSDFAGDPIDVWQDIEGSTYELKEEGWCLENHGLKDASTKLNEKKTPICFSLEGLKRLPIQAVPFQLVALAVHEHAHHYGFNENDAMKAQKVVLSRLTEGILNSTYLDSLSPAGALRDLSLRLIENLKEEYSDKLVCKHLTKLDTIAEEIVKADSKINQDFEIRMLITALDYDFKLTKESLLGADEASKITSGMLGFCGGDLLVRSVNFKEQVPEGDRKKLRESLKRLADIGDRLVQQSIEISRKRTR